MTHDQMADSLYKYFTRTPQHVIEVTAKYLKGVAEKDLPRLLDHLTQNNDPAKLIGLNVVREACINLNVPVSLGVARQESWYVDCAACGQKYLYLQGSGNGWNGAYDACPTCLLPYIETWEYSRLCAQGEGKKGEAAYNRSLNWHRAIGEKARAKVGATRPKIPTGTQDSQDSQDSYLGELGIFEPEGNLRRTGSVII